MRYRDKIIEYFDNLPEGSVVMANELYEQKFAKMSEMAFFKALERLTADGYLRRVSKGMYALATQSEAEDKILNFYFGENNDNGMYIGTQLYVKYGLTKLTDDRIDLYSNAIVKETSNVGNIHVRRVNIELNYENARLIEALEILQNYDSIPELNKMKFAKYARQFARSYDDDTAVYVINNMKYRKNTIAFMKKILDMYKVGNSLQQFLSHASRYKVPTVQRVAR